MLKMSYSTPIVAVHFVNPKHSDHPLLRKWANIIRNSIVFVSNDLNFTLDLCLSRIEDTLGHTLTQFFSVECC